jgi:hypothetical protein
MNDTKADVESPPADTQQQTGNQGAEDTSLLLDTLAQMLQRWQEESRRQQRPWMVAGSLILAMGVATTIFGLMYSAGSRTDYMPAVLAFGGLFVAMLSALLFSMAGATMPLTEAQQQIKTRIEALDDSTAVPVLLGLVDTHRIRTGNPLQETRVILAGPLRASVLATLTRLLSQMDARQVVDRLHAHIAELLRLLNSNMAISQPDLVIAVLRLLPALADKSTLAPTAYFIVADAPTHNEQQVREVAREVLPKLLARVDLGGRKHLALWIERLPVGERAQATMFLPESILAHLAVMKLLPQTEPGEFLALPPHIRQALYHNLLLSSLPRLKEQYSLIVLDMIYRATDVDALPTVQQLFGGGIAASPYAQVREAARACADLLKAQIEKEMVGKTLLRGASAPTADPETLLRAASGVASADPQLLLRANVQESIGKPDLETERRSSVSRSAPTGEQPQQAILRRPGEPR